MNFESEPGSMAIEDCTEIFRCEAGMQITQDGTCEMCPAGFFCLFEEEDPTWCPIGSYCPAGSAAPIECPMDTTTEYSGAMDAEECMDDFDKESRFDDGTEEEEEENEG